MAYNKDTDYSLLMQEAASRGDYAAAAKYEQQRNEKIQSEGLNYSTTSNYSKYLTPENFTGSATGVVTHNNSQQSIQQQMNANSQQWWEADAAGKAALEEANRQLAAQLGSGVTFDSQSGKWSGVADAPLSLQTGVDPVQPTFSLDSLGARPTYDSSSIGAQPTYTSQYEAQIDALLNDILNREQFSYDVETDPLYQQYKTMYNREGTRAMNDTLASVASGAGGMSSYAITAASQANDYYNAQLNDKIPELYQLAYSMYMNDLGAQRDDLSMLQSAESMDYSKYLDSLNQWNTDRDFAYGQYRDSVSDWENDRNFAYNQYRDEMGDYQWGTEFNYNAGRDQVADSQWQQEFDYMKEQDALDRQQWQTEFDYQKYLDELARQEDDDDDEDVAPTYQTGSTYQAPQVVDTSYLNSQVSSSTPAYGDTIAVNRDDYESSQGETINGKPVDEYEEAAGNYKEVAYMCQEIYRTQGKEAVLALLREAYSTGALNLTDYSTLYSKYRNMK